MGSWFLPVPGVSVLSCIRVSQPGRLHAHVRPRVSPGRSSADIRDLLGDTQPGAGEGSQRRRQTGLLRGHLLLPLGAGPALSLPPRMCGRFGGQQLGWAFCQPPFPGDQGLGRRVQAPAPSRSCLTSAAVSGSSQTGPPVTFLQPVITKQTRMLRGEFKS